MDTTRKREKDCPVDFSDVTFEFGQLEIALRQDIAALLEIMLKDYPPRVTLPYHWKEIGEDGKDGAPLTEPLEMSIELPALGDEDKSPEYVVSFPDVLKYSLTQEENGQYIRTCSDEVMRETAAALEQLAEWLRQLPQE